MENKVKSFLFKNPETYFHIREIARELKVSPNSVRKVVQIFKQKGIVEEKKVGNMRRFRCALNEKSYLVEKKLENLKEIYYSGLVEFLNNFYSPKAIVLFGSYMRGEDLSTSDIDIGVITSNKDRLDLKKFEDMLNRSINISLFTRKDVSEEFFNNIVNGVVLSGRVDLK